MISRILRSKRMLVAGAVLLLGAGLLPSTATQGHAAATVAKIVFSPDPIGTVNTVPPSTLVNITATAEDSHGVAIPGATLYMSFRQAVGGGTAFVATAPLKRHPAKFVANGSGVITVSYTTPPTPPAQGEDLITAQNSQVSATLKVHDAMCFSSLTALVFQPTPVAKKSSLGVSTTVPITLTAFGPNSARAANSPVYLIMRSAAGGGSAMVGTTALSKKAQTFTTDVNGNITINYTTPATLPASGADVIIASDAASSGCVTTSDAYRY